MALGGFTAAAAKVVLGVETEQFTAGIRGAEAEFVQATHGMSGAITELRERQLRAELSNRRYAESLKMYKVGSLEAQAAMANLVRDHRKLIEVQNQGIASSMRFERGMLAGATKGHGFGRAISFASNAFLGGAGFIYAVHAAVSAASKFQGEMTLIQTQALATHREVTKMSAAVLKLSPALATGPEALAKGLYRVESSGYRGAKALAVMTTAAKGARLGHADLEATTNSLVAAQKSGIKGAGNLNVAMGVLDATIGAGNMRMEELTKALASGVLPSARQAGVSLGELGGALATLTVTGTPAELAATRLRYSLALLAAQTPKAEKELRSIGLSADQLGDTIRNKGLVPALELLDQKLKLSGLGMTAQHRILERAFGGGRSYSTILTLLQQLDMVRSKTALINKSGSEFGMRWAAQTRTAEYAFDRLKAVADVVKIRLGNALLPPSVNVANSFSRWLEKSANQQKLQRDVKEGFKLASEGAHVFGDALHQLNDALHMTESLLGGTGHALTLLLEAMVLRKVLSFGEKINYGVLNPLRRMTGALKEGTKEVTALDEAMAGPAGGSAVADRPVVGRTGLPLPGLMPWREVDAERAAERLKQQEEAAAAHMTDKATTATAAATAAARTDASERQVQTDAIVEQTAALEQQSFILDKNTEAMARSFAAVPLRGLAPNDPAMVQASSRMVATTGTASVKQMMEVLGLSNTKARSVMQELEQRGVVGRTAANFLRPNDVHGYYHLAERIAVEAGERGKGLSAGMLQKRLSVPREEAQQMIAQLQQRSVIATAGKRGFYQPILTGIPTTKPLDEGGPLASESPYRVAPHAWDMVVQKELERSLRMRPLGGGVPGIRAPFGPLSPEAAGVSTARPAGAAPSTMFPFMFAKQNGEAMAVEANAAAKAAYWNHMLSEARLAVVRTGSSSQKMLMSELGIHKEMAAAVKTELNASGFLVQAKQGASMAAEAQTKYEAEQARIMEYGSREAMVQADAIAKLEQASKGLSETLDGYVMPSVEKGIALTKEQIYSLEQLQIELDQTGIAYRKEAAAASESASGITRMTQAEARAARLSNRLNERAGGKANPYVMGTFRGGMSQGGEELFLAQKEQQLSRMGAVRGRVGGGIRGIGGAVSGNAMGYGLAGMLFGNQISRVMPGAAGNGLASMITGGGTGLMLAPMLGVNPLLGAAIGASFGIKHAVGGKAGSILGNVGEATAAGAIAGSVIPGVGTGIGAAAGAAVGLSISLMGLSHHADATATDLDKLATAAKTAAGRASAARSAIAITQGNLVNDRVTRDEAKLALDAAKAHYKAAKGTDAEKFAVDNLRAAQTNYHASVNKVAADEKALGHFRQTVTNQTKKSETEQDKLVQKLVEVGNQARKTGSDFQARFGASAQSVFQGTNVKVQIFIEKMHHLAQSVKDSNPKLAHAAGELARIAAQANKIPPKKTIAVIVKFGYDAAALTDIENRWLTFTSKLSGNPFASSNNLFGTSSMGGVFDPTQKSGAVATFTNGKWYGPTGAVLKNQQAGYAAWMAAGNGPTKPPEGATVKLSPPKKPRVHTHTTAKKDLFVEPSSSQELAKLDAQISAVGAGEARGNVRSLIHQELAWLHADYGKAKTFAQQKEITDRETELKGQLAALDSKEVRNGGLGLIPQRYQDRVANAIASGSKPKQLSAYNAELKWVEGYLEKHPTGLAHKKAEDLRVGIVHHIDRLTKSITASAGMSAYLPQGIQTKLQDDLDNVLTHGGNATTLKKERSDLLHFLSGKHSPAEYKAALKELVTTNKRIGMVGKKGSGYGPVIEDLEKEKADLEQRRRKPGTSFAVFHKIGDYIIKIDNQEASFKKKQFAVDHKGQTALEAALGPHWAQLEIKGEKAKRTLYNTTDDVQALRSEQKFLQHWLADHPGHGKLQVQANKLLTSIDGKLAKLVNTQQTALRVLEKNFLDQLAGFYNTYASNDFNDRGPGAGVGNRPRGGHVITVENHYPNAPKNHHREAVKTMHAVRAAVGHLDY